MSQVKKDIKGCYSSCLECQKKGLIAVPRRLAFGSLGRVSCGRTDSLSLSSSLPCKPWANFQTNLVERHSISSLRRYSQASSLLCSRIIHSVSIQRSSHFTCSMFSSPHRSRILEWKKQQLKQISERRQAVRNTVLSIRLRKKHLMKLIKQKRKIEKLSLNDYRPNEATIFHKTCHKEELVCHKRAQALRKQLAEGVAAARQNLLQERVEKAIKIRKESKSIDLLVHEMKERDIQWKQRIRRHVLMTRNASHPLRKNANGLRLPMMEGSSVEDINLCQLQKELALILQQESVLTDELLELKELFQCLKQKK